jgi:predicted nucleic acid-binding protein
LLSAPSPWVCCCSPQQTDRPGLAIRSAVIDSSCVIALDALDLLPQLAVMFSRLLLPKAVRAELYRRRRMKDRLRALLSREAFLQPCDDYDQGVVDVLLTRGVLRGKKDRGETEAVVQAQMLGALVLIDERKGRKLAAQYALECHGTIWILRRLHDLDLIPVDKLAEYVRHLRKRGIRLPLREVNELLREIGAD